MTTSQASDVVLEYWSTGVLEYWSTGVLGLKQLQRFVGCEYRKIHFWRVPSEKHVRSLKIMTPTLQHSNTPDTYGMTV